MSRNPVDEFLNRLKKTTFLFSSSPIFLSPPLISHQGSKKIGIVPILSPTRYLIHPFTLCSSSLSPYSLIAPEGLKSLPWQGQVQQEQEKTHKPHQGIAHQRLSFHCPRQYLLKASCTTYRQCRNGRNKHKDHWIKCPCCGLPSDISHAVTSIKARDAINWLAPPKSTQRYCHHPVSTRMMPEDAGDKGSDMGISKDRADVT